MKAAVSVHASPAVTAALTDPAALAESLAQRATALETAAASLRAAASALRSLTGA
jgi:hypothetical protein